jgi:hypothetical protein
MSGDRNRRLRGVLPLPRFVWHPLTALIVAGVHVYLAAGHLSRLFGGAGVSWTDVWKGFGALAGAYVFTALASRSLPRQRASAISGEDTDRQSMASPST